MRRKILSFIPLLPDIFIFSCLYLLLSCVSSIHFTLVNLCRWLLHRLVVVQEFVSIRLRRLFNGSTLNSLTFWQIGIILIPVLLASILIESMFFFFPGRRVFLWKIPSFEERLSRLIILWMHIKQLLRSDNPALILISDPWPLKLEIPRIVTYLLYGFLDGCGWMSSSYSGKGFGCIWCGLEACLKVSYTEENCC